MKLGTNDSSWTKIKSQAVWLVTLFVLLAGYQYLRETIVLILTKLYEIFIQQKLNTG